MKLSIAIIPLVMYLVSFSTDAYSELNDPRYRDEDISASTVNSRVSMLASGVYEYLYTVTSADSNKGNISSFSIDIYCDMEFEPASYPEPIDQYFNGDYSVNKKHIPLQSYSVERYTATMGISIDNSIFWTFTIKPGESVEGFRILSPVPPGNVDYSLGVEWNSFGWDYDSYEPSADNLPTYVDFEVKGQVIGPRCPNKKNDTFSGSNKYDREAQNINDLLSYEKPLSDRFHINKTTSEIEMVIHYSESMIPSTFKVEPANLKKYFDPIPGSKQRLFLPLKNNKNKTKIRLSVRTNSPNISEKIVPGKLTDYDEFEIRLD